VPSGVAVQGGSAEPNTVLADFVHITRAKGVLAAAAASPSAPAETGTVSVITDTGRSFALANRSLVSKLGYAGVKPAQVPSELVSMLPRGPSLDPARARQTEVQ